MLSYITSKRDGGYQENKESRFQVLDYDVKSGIYTVNRKSVVLNKEHIQILSHFILLITSSFVFNAHVQRDKRRTLMKKSNLSVLPNKEDFLRRYP